MSVPSAPDSTLVLRDGSTVSVRPIQAQDVDARSEVADVDFNPVIVHPSGAVIVDARIRVEPAPLDPFRVR